MISPVGPTHFYAVPVSVLYAVRREEPAQNCIPLQLQAATAVKTSETST